MHQIWIKILSSIINMFKNDIESGTKIYKQLQILDLICGIICT